MKIPIRNTLRLPMMSPSLPIGIITALIVNPCTITTHEIARSVTSKSPAICVSATKIIDWLATPATVFTPIAMYGI
jgi:hypothetical protein